MKIVKNTLALIVLFSFIGCASSRDVATTRNLTGKWKITDIRVDIPADYRVINVFDEAPYQDFKESTWDLVRNGNGSFNLANGKSESIYWSINGKGSDAVFQFKKLHGEKAKNVTEGYRLSIASVSENQFTLVSPVLLDDGTSRNITYIFTRQ